MRGLVPRWGWRGAWQNPPCQFAVPSHNSRFSYLGGPAPAGTSDWSGTMFRSLNREGRLPPHPRESLTGAIRESPWAESSCQPARRNAGRPERIQIALSFWERVGVRAGRANDTPKPAPPNFIPWCATSNPRGRSGASLE